MSLANGDLTVYRREPGECQIDSLADKIAYQKNLLSGFLWLPVKLSYKMYAFLAGSLFYTA